MVPQITLQYLINEGYQAKFYSNKALGVPRAHTHIYIDHPNGNTSMVIFYPSYINITCTKSIAFERDVNIELADPDLFADLLEKIESYAC